MAPLVVLVTGCAEGGLGWSLCTEFAKRGCAVWAAGPNPEKEFKSLAGVVAGTATLDVTDGESVKACVAKVGQGGGLG